MNHHHDWINQLIDNSAIDPGHCDVTSSDPTISAFDINDIHSVDQTLNSQHLEIPGVENSFSVDSQAGLHYSGGVEDSLSTFSHHPPDSMHTLQNLQESHPWHNYPGIMQSPSTMHSSNSVYTTISDHGKVYKHTSDHPHHSNYAGYIQDRSIYNPSGAYQGYGGTDGKIYDHHNHCIGWVDGCGDVYNTAGVQVYHTTKGVVGGAAYVLLVYHGGIS